MVQNATNIENKLIGKTRLIQFGWGAAVFSSFAFNLLHIFTAFKSLPVGSNQNEFLADASILFTTHLLIWLAGYLLLKFAFSSLKQKIADYNELLNNCQASDAHYRQLFTNMPLGFATHEMIFDDAGNPVDYRFLEVNPAFEKMTGLSASEIVGKTVLEVLPKTEDVWIKRFAKVAIDGVCENFEEYSSEFDCWYDVFAYSPERGEFAVIVQDVTERDQIMETLLEYQYIIENSKDMIFSLDKNRRYQMANETFLKIRGVTLEDLVGKTPEELLGVEIYKKQVEGNLELAYSGETTNFMLDFTDSEQNLRHFYVTYQPMLRDDGSVKRVFGIASDITERMELEGELLQAQKMESIGTLAGGVAHDFNNILTVIMGSVDYLLTDCPVDNEFIPFLTQIKSAAERAVNLTQSLLAFSRKQSIQVEKFDLNTTVGSINDFIGSLIGENLHIVLNLSHSPLYVCADRGQIEQVLMNLVINARDAMDSSGIIIVDTKLIHSDEIEPEIEGIKSGNYALVSIKDTGCGMSEKVVSRIFEPFFTTKELGHGTGLGLSVVYGIIRQHEGFINVHSVEGVGSTFNVYLPLAENEHSVFSVVTEDAVAGGDETILLIEDDDDVRFMNAIILKNSGYNVLEASNTDEALSILRSASDKISLVVSDVMMPGMNGKDFADIIKLIFPELPILFITGYGAEALGKHGIITEDMNLLLKPLNITRFRNSVRELIDGNPKKQGKDSAIFY